jgi:hypothetical protein
MPNCCARRAAAQLRGLTFTLAEVPTGVGGPLSPVEKPARRWRAAATGVTVATSATELGVLASRRTISRCREPWRNPTAAPFPSLDPAVIGLLNFTHQSTPETDYPVLRHQCSGDQHHHRQRRYFQQGFSTGGTASLTFNNAHTNWNATTSGFNPFNGSSLGSPSRSRCCAASATRSTAASSASPAMSARSPACSSSSSSSTPSTAWSASTPILWRSTKTKR